MVTDEAQWYVQKGSRVQGPFSTDEVGRFLLLGRVRNTDRVSRDGELWEPVTQVPELIPEELLNLHSVDGWSNFITARSASEERKSIEAVEIERRGSSGELAAEQLREQWAGTEKPEAVHSVLPWSLLGITLAALVTVLYLNANSTLGG
ncbi:MAG: DUF4339 domain-containing protein [Granulosicoccus sp.]|nr:DUF4339 domain-containing protein [Granulosicoccus sp.]